MNKSWQGLRLLALIVVCGGTTSAHASDPPESQPERKAKLPEPLVFLRDVDATIIQDIRYATTNNFTGARVKGYDAAECILTRTAAEALRRVQADLKERGLSLKVYDCYRPKQAVKAFVQWAQASSQANSQTSAAYNPNVPRGKLIALGYISASSSHSRADTVDITIMSPFTPDAQKADTHDISVPCTAKGSDGSIDMGTSFDCFDPKSNTSSAALTTHQRKSRYELTQNMTKRGFKNYPAEWWHFTYGSGTGPSYDFPITAKP